MSSIKFRIKKWLSLFMAVWVVNFATDLPNAVVLLAKLIDKQVLFVDGAQSLAGFMLEEVLEIENQLPKNSKAGNEPEELKETEFYLYSLPGFYFSFARSCGYIQQKGFAYLSPFYDPLAAEVVPPPPKA